MSKTNRIYKIFMTTMIVAIAGMLLAMGIIAAQKTMKLGVQFSSNPNYKLVIAINNEDNVVFQNFDTVIMDKGISNLKGDTLIADDDVFKDYGNDFTIIIKNYTESTGIEVAMESTAKIDGGADGIPAQIEAIKDKAIKYDPDTKIADSVSFRIYINSVFPQTTTLKMTISELSVVNITFDANGGSFANSETTSSVPVTAGSNYTLPTAPTRENYVFLGWATTNDATETSWESGTQIASSEITWFAVWERVIYDVTVDMTLYWNTTQEVITWEFQLDTREVLPFSQSKTISHNTKLQDPRLRSASGINEDHVSLSVTNYVTVIEITFTSFDSITQDIYLECSFNARSVPN